MSNNCLPEKQHGLVDIKKIHIWESEGFWVLDFYNGEVINGSSAIKLCSASKPKIVFQKSKYRKHIAIKAEAIKHE